MTLLRGKKCGLRSVVSSDVGTILLWENDPALAPYSDPHEPYTREDIELFIEQQQAGFKANGQLRLMIEVSGQAIGAIDLFNYDGHSAEVGVLIYEPQMRRNGYATDALQSVIAAARSLDIELLSATISDDNPASQALFRRCGFIKEKNNRYIYRIEA